MAVFDPFGSGPSTEQEVLDLTGKSSDQIDLATRRGHRRVQLDRRASNQTAHEPGVWGGSKTRRGGHGY